MTYDFHGSWDGQTGENSPLYKGPADTGDLVYLNVVSIFSEIVSQMIIMTPVIRSLRSHPPAYRSWHRL